MVCSIATGDLSTQRFNSPEVFIPIPPCPSARDDGGSRQHTVISKGDTNERNTALPCRHFDRSEVEKSHSPMVCSIATGDLSTQRFNSPEVFIPIPPCPSARDDGGGRQHTIISKGDTNDRNTTLPCRHFDRSEAKWRNLTPQMAETLPPTRHFDESAAEQLNLTSPWYTRMAAGGPPSQGSQKGAVRNDVHFPQPLLPVSGSSYFNT